MLLLNNKTLLALDEDETTYELLSNEDLGFTSKVADDLVDNFEDYPIRLFFDRIIASSAKWSTIRIAASSCKFSGKEEGNLIACSRSIASTFAEQGTINLLMFEWLWDKEPAEEQSLGEIFREKFEMYYHHKRKCH